MTAAALALIIVALMLGAIVQSVTGFGYALVAMPLLALCIDYQTALAMVAVSNVLVCIMTLRNQKLKIEIGEGWRLFISMLIGMPIGVFLVTYFDQQLMLRGLGFIMVGVVVCDYLRYRGWIGQLPQWAAYPLGFLSGFLAGSFNTGGPPAVVFAYSQPWTKLQILSTLQVCFLATTSTRVPMLWMNGLLTEQVGFLLVVTVVPLIIALLIGGWIFRRVPQAQLVFVVRVFLVVMGFKYLLFP